MAGEQELKTMPKGWMLTTLGDVADINSLAIDKNYPSEEIEYIDIASVEERRVMQTQMLGVKDAPSRAKRIVRDNDILISTVRPNLKHYCFIKKASNNLIASTGFAVISAKKASAYFLYYLLTADEYTDYLSKIADSHTSAYPSFNPEVIANSRFAVPSLPEQKAIAAVLSALDDKIELLQKNNKTLENIAQTLFKRWFVDYEFPNEKGKPYKSSGGKMIDSELGNIPAGWRFGYLEECIQILSGGTPKTSIGEYWNGNIPWFSVVDTPKESDVFVIDCEKCISELGLDNSSTQLLPVNTTIITARGTVGKLALTGVPMAMNQSCYGIRPKNDKDVFYIYRLMKESLEVLKGRVHGAVFDTITRDTLNNIPCVIPSPQIIGLFEQTVRPIFQKVLMNNFHIQTLSRLRDSLLPKLMKGEVRVKGFNKH